MLLGGSKNEGVNSLNRGYLFAPVWGGKRSKNWSEDAANGLALAAPILLFERMSPESKRLVAKRLVARIPGCNIDRCRNGWRGFTISYQSRRMSQPPWCFTTDNRHNVAVPSEGENTNTDSPGVFAINYPPGWSGAAASAKCISYEPSEVSLGWKRKEGQEMDACLTWGVISKYLKTGPYLVVFDSRSLFFPSNIQGGHQ